MESNFFFLIDGKVYLIGDYHNTEKSIVGRGDLKDDNKNVQTSRYKINTHCEYNV